MVQRVTRACICDAVEAGDSKALPGASITRMDYSFASATILLLLITDPLGNIPVFIHALRSVPRQRRALVVLR